MYLRCRFVQCEPARPVAAGHPAGGSVDRVSVLGTAPWRRAPLLLRGSPAVLAAVVGAGLILGAAAAATPLFLSSAGNAAQARQLGERCKWMVRTGTDAP